MMKNVLAIMWLMKKSGEKFSGTQMFFGRSGEVSLSSPCLGQEVMEDFPPTPVDRKGVRQLLNE
jgi:hypothetical protein